MEVTVSNALEGFARKVIEESKTKEGLIELVLEDLSCTDVLDLRKSERDKLHDFLISNSGLECFHSVVAETCLFARLDLGAVLPEMMQGEIGQVGIPQDPTELSSCDIVLDVVTRTSLPVLAANDFYLDIGVNENEAEAITWVEVCARAEGYLEKARKMHEDAANVAEKSMSRDCAAGYDEIVIEIRDLGLLHVGHRTGPKPTR